MIHIFCKYSKILNQVADWFKTVKKTFKKLFNKIVRNQISEVQGVRMHVCVQSWEDSYITSYDASSYEYIITEYLKEVCVLLSFVFCYYEDEHSETSRESSVSSQMIVTNY